MEVVMPHIKGVGFFSVSMRRCEEPDLYQHFRQFTAEDAETINGCSPAVLFPGAKEGIALH
jgi:hypothetical protein